MSIAITTVLPASGRHLQGRSRKPVVVSLVLGLEPPAPVGVPVVPARDLGEEDRRLGRLALREDDAVLAVLVGPVLEQLAGDRRDAAVLTVATPLRDVPPDLVDQLVALPAFAGDVEVDRLLNRLALLALLGHGDRDPGLTRPAAVLDHPGRPVRSDLVVPVGLRVRRVEDRVIYGCCLAAVTAGFDHRRSVTLDPTDEHHGPSALDAVPQDP